MLRLNRQTLFKTTLRTLHTTPAIRSPSTLSHSTAQSTTQQTPLNNKSQSQIHETVANGIKVAFNKKSTSFQFLNQENKSYSYNNVFLRDSSQSSTSVDHDSGQKLFTTASIIDAHPTKVEILNDNQIEIHWNDGEISNYDQRFLEFNSTIESRKVTKAKNFEDEITPWDSNHNMLDYDNLPKYDYNEYLQNESITAKVLNDLNKIGLAQIINVDGSQKLTDQQHEDTPLIKTMAERIAYIKQTFYGEIFDVKSIPNATNIAYTSQFLPLHMDLLYYESPPGLQLLHFIKNKSTGGENVFADGFAAARHVKTIDSPAYQALLTVPINYHYEKDGHSYYYSRPLIVEDEVIGQGVYGDKDHFREVNYSPPFQAPFDFGITGDINLLDNGSKMTGAKEKGDRHLFQDFLRGFKEFEDYINDSANQLKFKVEEGTCIIFDNRRILHARDQFDSNSGERWLKGCYIDKDAYLSKLRVLKNK